MSQKQKLLLLCAGVWASTITVITIQNTLDNKFNLTALQDLVRYIEQQQYDGEFSKIVNNFREPPFK